MKKITISFAFFSDGYDEKTVEIIKFLVEKSEGNVNTQSDAGFTPLHLVSWTPNGAQLIPLFAKVCENEYIQCGTQSWKTSRLTNIS